MISGLQSRGAIDLESYAASADSAVFGELVRKVGRAPRFDDIDRLQRARNVSTELRKLVDVILQSERGLGIAAGGRTLARPRVEGEPGTKVLTLDEARLPHGKSELVQAIEARMPNALVGQRQTLAAWLSVARRHESPVYPQRAVIGLNGERGHGKDEAVRAFCELVEPEGGAVLEVDVGGGKKVGDVFGEGAPLHAETLADHRGVIRISGADNLASANTKMATALAEFLSTEVESSMPRHIVIFDFDGDDSRTVTQKMAGALGKVGPRVLAARADFVNLDPEAMKVYLARAIPRILSHGGGHDAVIRFSPDAEALLARALATPYEPLYELDERLHHLVFSLFEANPSIDFSRSAVEIQVAPHYRESPKEADALVEAFLHAEVPELDRGRELFSAVEVGRVGVDAEEREALMQLFTALLERLETCGAQLAPEELAASGPTATELEKITSLGRTILGELAEREKAAKLRLLSTESKTVFEARAETTRATIEEFLEATPLSDDAQSARTVQQARGWAGFAALLLESAKPLLSNLHAGQGLEPVELPAEPEFEALRVAVAPGETPEAVMKLQSEFGAAYPPPQVQIRRTEQGDGWAIRITSRLPESDEAGALAFEAELAISEDAPRETNIVVHGEECGFDLLDSELAELGFDPASDELMVAMIGLGYGLVVKLPTEGDRAFDSDARLEQWGFSAELANRAWLQRSMLESASMDPGEST